MLGKMFRKFNERLSSISTEYNQSYECKMPDEIRSILEEYQDKDMEEKIFLSLQSYIQNRAMQNQLDYGFFDWRSNYFSNERKNYVLDRKNPNKVAIVDAALIYKKSLLLEHKDVASRACEFAWGICFDELIDIFAGENKISVSCHAQHFVLK